MGKTFKITNSISVIYVNSGRAADSSTFVVKVEGKGTLGITETSEAYTIEISQTQNNFTEGTTSERHIVSLVVPKEEGEDLEYSILLDSSENVTNLMFRSTSALE